MLEHVATPFDMYHGSIDYGFQLVCPQLATVRLAVTITPGLYGVPAAGVADVSRACYQEFQLTPKSNYFTMSAPYSSVMPWTRVPVFDPSGAARADPLQYSNGEIFLTLVNPYTVNETMSQSIDVNIFMSAGPDFDLKGPNANLARISLLPAVDQKQEEPFVFMRSDPVRLNMLKSGAVGGQSMDGEVKHPDSRPLGGAQAAPLAQDGISALPSRRYIVNRFAWTTSHAQGATLASLSIPNDVLPPGPIRQMYRMAMFQKLQMVLHFELESSPFQQGQLVAYMAPFSCPILPDEISLQSSMVMPHVLLTAGWAADNRLTVPFLHPANALQESGPDISFHEQARVDLRVFNPLLVGPNAVDPTGLRASVLLSVEFKEFVQTLPNPLADP